MLKLAPEPTFVVGVALPVPGQPDQLVNVTFRHQGRAALRGWLDAAREAQSDAALLGEVIAGWKGIDAEYSAANLAALLDAYPGAGGALFNAYVAELGKAAAKN